MHAFLLPFPQCFAPSSHETWWHAWFWLAQVFTYPSYCFLDFFPPFPKPLSVAVTRVKSTHPSSLANPRTLWGQTCPLNVSFELYTFTECRYCQYPDILNGKTWLTRCLPSPQAIKCLVWSWIFFFQIFPFCNWYNSSVGLLWILSPLPLLSFVPCSLIDTYFYFVGSSTSCTCTFPM